MLSGIFCHPRPGPAQPGRGMKWTPLSPNSDSDQNGLSAEVWRQEVPQKRLDVQSLSRDKQCEWGLTSKKTLVFVTRPTLPYSAPRNSSLTPRSRFPTYLNTQDCECTALRRIRVLTASLVAARRRRQRRIPRPLRLGSGGADYTRRARRRSRIVAVGKPSKSHEGTMHLKLVVIGSSLAIPFA